MSQPFAFAAVLALLLLVNGSAQTEALKNIVLVHGAWVDGSGWKPVYDILVKDGYTVSIVQEPLTSFAEDVAATRRIMALQPGPFVLVGHSYGASEARSQALTAVANFSGTIATPAWRSKPSWMIVAGADRIINPDLERWYAKRANSHVKEVAGASHSVYESRPKEVAAVIEDAARSANN